MRKFPENPTMIVHGIAYIGLGMTAVIGYGASHVSDAQELYAVALESKAVLSPEAHVQAQNEFSRKIAHGLIGCVGGSLLVFSGFERFGRVKDNIKQETLRSGDNALQTTMNDETI